MSQRITIDGEEYVLDLKFPWEAFIYPMQGQYKLLPFRKVEHSESTHSVVEKPKPAPLVCQDCGKDVLVGCGHVCRYGMFVEFSHNAFQYMKEDPKQKESERLWSKYTDYMCENIWFTKSGINVWSKLARILADAIKAEIKEEQQP